MCDDVTVKFLPQTITISAFKSFSIGGFTTSPLPSSIPAAPLPSHKLPRVSVEPY